MISQFLYKFLFVLSFTYIAKYFLELVIKLILTESTPIKISKVEGVFYYLAVSYIITFLLT